MNKHWLRYVAALALVATPALAQTPGNAPRAGEVASDPIRCWWKADRTAVRVGERFELVLTCGVIEAGSTTVVAHVNQLEPGALGLTPFEVVSGSRREDVVAPPWRYFQFEYTVRLLSDGFFGQDINIPALTVTYNLQAPGGGTQGRDQNYILPALPMRILSLVPRSAADIRDASDQTFATIESRRFRASAAVVAAVISFAFAAVLAGIGLARIAGQVRGRAAAQVRPLAPASLLRASLAVLADVKDEAARAGWSAELTRRAAAPLRVAGAVALGRRVHQALVERDAAIHDGQIEVRTGLLRRRRALVSAPTTPATVPTSGNRDAATAEQPFEAIRDALRTFSLAGYGRNGQPDGAALDAALEDGARAIRRLRVTTWWPVRTVGAAFGRPLIPTQASGRS